MLVLFYNQVERKLPASIAFLAASLKSLTICGISSVLNRLGGVYSATSTPLDSTWGVSGLSVQETGACPFGCKTESRTDYKNHNLNTEGFVWAWSNDQ